MPVEQLPGLEHEPGADERATEPTPLVESIGVKPPSAHTQRGEFLRRIGNLDQALSEIEAALKANPEDAYALATKGRILRDKACPDDAVELIARAVHLDPGLDWALLELTELLIRLERERDAEEICAELLKTHAENAPAQGIFGRLLSQTGELKRAAGHLAQAVELRSDLAWLHAQFGEVLRRQGNPRTALDSFNEAENVANEKSLSGDVTAWILTRKGLSLLHVRRYREALDALTQALVLSPRYTLAMRLKARALWKGDQRKECFEFLARTIRDSANPIWAEIELVNYARDMGLLEEALALLDVCLADNPKSPKLLVQLLIRKGELLHRVGDFEAAVRTLVKAEEIAGKNWRALHLRGSALKYLGGKRNGEALAAIEKALQIAGSLPSLLIARADVLRAQGDPAGAKRDYKDAVEQLDKRRKERPQSMDAETLWLMGWCWLWLDANDVAFRLLAHAKSLEPDLYIARFYLGLALLIRGQMVQAQREYDAALEAIREKSPLLRRGILRSSLYMIPVAYAQQETPSKGEAEVREEIVKRLEKELKGAIAEIANNQPKGTTSEEEELKGAIIEIANNQSKGAGSILGIGPTDPSVSAKREDDSEVSKVTPRVNLLFRPAADPMVPMIRLDHMFKILDWNIAASLAFDETLEGRRGQYVGDWIVHFFDNPLDVAEHGQSAFGDQDRLPAIDVEEQEFPSRTYGKLSMTKRAFMIPNDDNKTCLGWLLIFELRFGMREHSWRFKKNLTNELNRDSTWSAHAVSYDAVLSYSSVYDELLRTLTGETGPLQRIPDGARVLDLGAGTGGLTLKLATSLNDAFIVAVDNNNAMLDLLQDKCRPYMRLGTPDRGVVATRQDITKLSGIVEERKGTFDYAFLANVLNTVSEPEKALKGVYELLKPGGEIRITGPRGDSKVEVLFDAIRQDLEKQGRFEELEPYYEDLRALNADQLSKTFRWTTEDVEQMLLDVGFPEIISRGEGVDVYAGQGMLVAARR